MLSKGFNKEFFESVYKLNECGGTGTGGCGANKASCGGTGTGGCGANKASCGGTGTGGCGANKASCGGSRCGINESLEKMNECGSSYSCDSAAIGGCGALGYHYSCEVGREVVIKTKVGNGCGIGYHYIEKVGTLLGYAD